MIIGAGRLALRVRGGRERHPRHEGPTGLLDRDRRCSRALHQAGGSPGLFRRRLHGRGNRAALSRSDLWVVDPIDGTANFARGIPHYCISIAFVSAGEIELGAIYNPWLDELYFARRGHGASRNGKPIRRPLRPISPGMRRAWLVDARAQRTTISKHSGACSKIGRQRPARRLGRTRLGLYRRRPFGRLRRTPHAALGLPCGVAARQRGRRRGRALPQGRRYCQWRSCDSQLPWYCARSAGCYWPAY